MEVEVEVELELELELELGWWWWWLGSLHCHCLPPSVLNYDYHCEGLVTLFLAVRAADACNPQCLFEQRLISCPWLFFHDSPGSGMCISPPVSKLSNTSFLRELRRTVLLLIYRSSTHCSSR